MQNQATAIDRHADTDTAASQRSARHVTHPEQHDAGVRLFADRAIGAMKLGLAVGKTEQRRGGESQIAERYDG